MAKKSKPVAGSRAFWPRKRAKRIYPRIKTWPELAKTLPLAFAGYKVGMTNITLLDNRKDSVTYGQEIVKPATVLDTPDLLICGIRTYKKTPAGLKASNLVLTEKLPKDLERKVKLPKRTKRGGIEIIEKNLNAVSQVRLLVCTQPRESGLRKKKPELFEIPISGNIEGQWKYAKEKLGKELKAEDVFSTGEEVDVLAVTKGKGLAGVVKRFGVKIRDRKSGFKRRHIGTLGPVTPRRILPGKVAMPGQLGYQTRTEYNKRILKIGNEGLTPKSGWLNYGVVPKNYILLEGSVPGPRKRLIILRKPIRAKGKPGPIEVKSIS